MVAFEDQHEMKMRTLACSGASKTRNGLTSAYHLARNDQVLAIVRVARGPSVGVRNEYQISVAA